MSHRLRGIARRSRAILAHSAIVCVSSAAATLSAPASAAEVCTSAAAQEALSACPAGKMAAAPIKKGGPPIKGASTVPKPKEAPTKPGAPPPQKIGEREARRQKAEAREYELLVTEIQGLESLLKNTPSSAPDRPKVMRRLADDYVELESAANRRAVQTGIQIDVAKKEKPGDVKGLTEKQAKMTAVVGSARGFAIKYYTQLKTDHPSYCMSVDATDATKSTGCGDEVLYYLAYEHEQGKQPDKARAVYLELVEKWPKSSYLPNAYLAFGELYFEEAQGDPEKWSLAEKAYSEVAKYPAPANKLLGYAHYKLGYVHWNKGDYQKAITEMKRTIDFGVKFPQIQGSDGLMASARKDLIPLYALSGEPKKAHDFFKPLSGDSGVETKSTFTMMDSLGEAYLDTGHYKEGVELYQDLMSRDRGAKVCSYQAHIVQATSAMKASDKDAIVGELNKLVDVYQKHKKEASYADEVKLACANATAELLSESAMAWHLEVIGTGGVRGTGDRKTMQLAADLYEKVLQGFTKEDFAKFKFSRIVEEDWPTVPKIKYLMADLVYFQKDWKRCGPAFDAVVAEAPDGPDAPEAAYTAALCYQNHYLETHANGADRQSTGHLPGSERASTDRAKALAPKELNATQKAMLGAFDRYICQIKPAAEDKAGQAQMADIKYARARLYLETNHWEEAALAFRDVATSHPGDDSAVFAAQLALEAENVLYASVEPRHLACGTDLARDSAKFVETFCSGAKEKENADQCGVLRRVARESARIEIESLAEIAKKGGPDAPKLWEKVAGMYMDLWKKHAEQACKDSRDAARREPACERAEELLYNASRAYQAARLVARSIEAKKILLKPDYHLEKTELARKAIYEIGGNYQAIASYEDSATWYERFARENPSMEKAPDALQDAIVLRLGLGQETQAMEDVALFRRSYGTQKPAQAAQVAFALALHSADRGQWDNARKQLSDAISAIDRSATLDVRIQSHALLGRAYEALGQTAQADSEYGKARSLWSDPAEAMKRMEASFPDEIERTRRTAKALTAVGEALFYFAEKKKKVVDKIIFPKYTGNGDRQDVLRHVDTKVADWVKKKRAAIEEADKEFRKIQDIKPSAPPRWVIAAGSRAGQMWSKFVAEFRAAPVPKEWKQKGPHPTIPGLTWEELLYAYLEKIDVLSEPFKQISKSAYKTCLDLSVQYQYFDDSSRQCELWLSKHYGAEYHAVDELRSAPSRVATGIGDKPKPVQIDGTFVATPTAEPADTKPVAPPASASPAASASPKPSAAPSSTPRP